MILQALKHYYERANLAPSGWEYKPIQFLIVISGDGTFVALNDRRLGERRAQPMLVPASEIRSGKNAWMQPNLLWDHYGFVLGERKRKPNGDFDPSDSPEKVAKQLDAFRNRISILTKRHPDSNGLAAINSFYARSEHVKVVESTEAAEMFRIPGANLTFQLANAVEPILHEMWVSSEAVAEDTDDATDTNDAHAGFCLVSAQEEQIARLHPKINGVCDKPTAFAAANTIQYPAFSSFGKEQGYNFPVGKPAASDAAWIVSSAGS